MRDETARAMRWRAQDGSGCSNDDCPASDTYRTVLSKQEIDRVFKAGAKDELPFEWPLPEDIEYACTRCGWLYTARANSATLGGTNPEIPESELRPRDLGMKIDGEAPPGVTVRKLIENAPDNVTEDQIGRAAERYIPGASEDLVRRLLDEAEAESIVRYPADSFM